MNTGHTKHKMAWKKKYRCEGCGYECEAYEGTGLFRQHITTVSCDDSLTSELLNSSFNSSRGMSTSLMKYHYLFGMAVKKS